MKKIFTFIGSPLQEKSNTYKFITNAIDKVKAVNPYVESIVYTGGMVNLEECRGCCLCMKKGICPYDAKDDMRQLKKYMLEADLIIFASPVYTFQVTGQMKVFLDRLATWCHIMKLTGKPAIVVSTTGGGGHKYVNSYMSMILSGMGAKVIGKFFEFTETSSSFRNEKRMLKKSQYIANKILVYINGRKKVRSDINLEITFKIMKMKSTKYRNEMPADYLYWKSNNMLDCRSYKQLLTVYNK